MDQKLPQFLGGVSPENPSCQDDTIDADEQMKVTKNTLNNALTESIRSCLCTQDHNAGFCKLWMDNTLPAISDLLVALNENDGLKVGDALSKLGTVSQLELFDEIGKLTRRLHSSLLNFKKELSPKVENITSKVPEASDRLQAVITMTDDAAHKVLSLVEKQSSVLTEQKETISKISTACGNGHKELLKEKEVVLTDYLEQTMHLNRQASAVNTEILIAQEFQDLSGQTLKKVIKLITEVEDGLVALLKMFGMQTNKEDSKPESKPDLNVDSDNTEKTACNQDNVDDLLASLGF